MAACLLSNITLQLVTLAVQMLSCDTFVGTQSSIKPRLTTYMFLLLCVRLYLARHELLSCQNAQKYWAPLRHLEQHIWNTYQDNT